ncbi:MAG: sigma-70 family RNA polymerase sigma factor [Bacilli bacterium]
MEELIIQNKNLIYAITKYFEKYGNKEDLFQAGCIGMMMAYKNYDPHMNVKFTTYAYPYILGEMKKLVREDKTLKVSRDLQKINLKIEKAYVLLTQKLMRVPTNEELSDFLEIPQYLISEALACLKPIYSIDEPFNSEGKEITLHDTIGQVNHTDLDLLLSLKDELNRLKPFERDLIEKRYMYDLTQQEVSNLLGISQVQVSRKEQKVLTKLKSKLVV